MSSDAKFKSNRTGFQRLNSAFKDMVLGNMALDMERSLKMDAGMPVKKGDMKAETRHFKAADGSFRVETDKEYAAVQEAGIRMRGPGAPTQPFTNYTTPGTSAGWFRRGINMILRNRIDYIKVAREALNL